MTSEEINHMVERFQHDASQRTKAKEYMAKLKERILEDELEAYFKPKINTSRHGEYSQSIVNTSHQFDSNMLSEKKEPQFKHIRSPLDPKPMTRINAGKVCKTIGTLSPGNAARKKLRNQPFLTY